MGQYFYLNIYIYIYMKDTSHVCSKCMKLALKYPSIWANEWSSSYASGHHTKFSVRFVVLYDRRPWSSHAFWSKVFTKLISRYRCRWNIIDNIKHQNEVYDKGECFLITISHNLKTAQHILQPKIRGWKYLEKQLNFFFTPSSHIAGVIDMHVVRDFAFWSV